jgi:hypothetical protein
MATTETDRYNAALFTTYLEEEFTKEREAVEDAVCGAILRFSPAATPAQVNAYVEDIADTITDDEGALRPDWKDLIIAEH